MVFDYLKVWEQLPLLTDSFNLRCLLLKNIRAIKETEFHIVPDLPSPMRLQEYGVGIFTTVATKSALKKILKKECIRVNGTIASTATLIRGGERISLSSFKDSEHVKKVNLRLSVLFEDDHLALIYKPAGLLVNGNVLKTVANGLPKNIAPSLLPDATRPQPVHRLDFATTGILLVGKTASSIRALNKRFEQRAIEKEYYAVTIGKMPSKGTITTEVDGKPSQTNYTVCGSVPSDRFGLLNLVLLHPKTGRRHQLRKHLSQMGNPILGDDIYGNEGLILKGKGLYLHAYSLLFTHPFTDKEIHFQAKLPKRFTKIFPADTWGIHNT